MPKSPTPKPTYTLNGGGVGGAPVKPSKSNADKYLDYTTWAIETTETKEDYNDTIKKIIAADQNVSENADYLEEK